MHPTLWDVKNQVCCVVVLVFHDLPEDSGVDVNKSRAMQQDRPWDYIPSRALQQDIPRTAAGYTLVIPTGPSHPNIRASRTYNHVLPMVKSTVRSPLRQRRRHPDIVWSRHHTSFEFSRTAARSRTRVGCNNPNSRLGATRETGALSTTQPVDLGIDLKGLCHSGCSSRTFNTACRPT